MDRARPKDRNAVVFADRLTGAPVALLFFVCLAAAAQETPKDPETPQATAEAVPAAKETVEFKPPPGYRRKKHGKLILYCRREAVLGSRFQAEKCYDQAGVEEMMRAQRENAEMLERIRNCAVGSCSTG